MSIAANNDNKLAIDFCYRQNCYVEFVACLEHGVRAIPLEN